MVSASDSALWPWLIPWSSLGLRFPREGGLRLLTMDSAAWAGPPGERQQIPPHPLFCGQGMWMSANGDYLFFIFNIEMFYLSNFLLSLKLNTRETERRGITQKGQVRLLLHQSCENKQDVDASPIYEDIIHCTLLQCSEHRGPVTCLPSGVLFSSAMLHPTWGWALTPQGPTLHACSLPGGIEGKPWVSGLTNAHRGLWKDVERQGRRRPRDGLGVRGGRPTYPVRARSWSSAGLQTWWRGLQGQAWVHRCHLGCHSPAGSPSLRT